MQELRRRFSRRATFSPRGFCCADPSTVPAFLLPLQEERERRHCARGIAHHCCTQRLSLLSRAHEGLRMATTTATRGLRLFGRRIRPEGVIALVGLAIVWQIASYYTPPYLFPSVPQIAVRMVEIFSSWGTVAGAIATALRILAGLAGAFVLGSLLAMLMARSDTFE